MTQTSDQRTQFLTRHLVNTLFYKLSRGRWRHVESAERPKFKIYGAGQAPPIPGVTTLYTYAWLATVSPSVPRLMIPMYAIFIDDIIYSEVLSQFTAQTKDNWRELLSSGTRQLYHLQDSTMRRNNSVSPLMCAVGVAFIERLQQMKLITPVRGADVKELQESHEQQLVLAALRQQDS